MCLPGRGGFNGFMNKTLQTLAFIFLAAVNTFALPILTQDSISVPLDDPRIGAEVFVLPGSVWRLWANDNPPKQKTNDWDFNDLVVDIYIGNDGSGRAKVAGTNSGWTNYMVIAGGLVGGNITETAWGPLEIGSKLPGYLIAQDGAKYTIGSQNILTDRVDEVPEPGAFVLTGLGAVLMIFGLRGRGSSRA